MTAFTPVQPDRLIDFHEVHRMLGLRCKTGHTARNLAARGQIRAVRINERTIRYSEASVQEMIAGRAPFVTPPPKKRKPVVPVS